MASSRAAHDLHYVRDLRVIHILAVFLAAILALLARPSEAESAQAPSPIQAEENCVAVSDRSILVPVTLPSWRNRYEAMMLSVTRAIPRGRGPLRISSELGLAGIDQAVLIPREPITITVRGKVISGEARLILGWGDNDRVQERERALKLVGGAQTFRFRPTSTQPLLLKVAVVQLTPRGIIELDAVTLRAKGRQLLRNSQLMAQRCRPSERRNLAEACVTRGYQTVNPDLLPVALIGWRDRFEAMTMVVARDTPRGPVRISSEVGPAGIDQTVLIPRDPVTIRVRGRVISGKARLILGWSENGRVQESERALKLRGGSQTIRFRPPTGTKPLRLTIGVVQLTPGAIIELDAVALEVRIGGMLQNGQLSSHLCVPTRPPNFQQACIV
ncbi:MAG: hypothetical protein H0U16_09005, partial [Actinobacteria bacterium]|nr:hypothetical protein [Actinomycetota bacterium]